jgi:hypothetical protein
MSRRRLGLAVAMPTITKRSITDERNSTSGTASRPTEIEKRARLAQLHKSERTRQALKGPQQDTAERAKSTASIGYAVGLQASIAPAPSRTQHIYCVL